MGGRLFINDCVWGAALLPALIIAAHIGSVVAFVLAWGISGAVAALFGWFQTQILPHPREMTGWLRGQRDLSVRYLVENVSNSGASQLRAYGLGAIAGITAVGAVRGAEQLLGPFLALLMGLSLVWCCVPYFFLGLTDNYALIIICSSLMGVGNNLWHPAAISDLSELLEDS